MKAVVRRGRTLDVDADYKLPDPGPGQVIARTLYCGICGSDLHALHHLDHMAETAKRSGSTTPLDATKDVVFGHEFCAEIVDFGPGSEKRLKRGTKVVSMPYALGSQGMELVGYSNTFPGGFAEYMVLQEELLLPVPDGLAADAAGLTEPLAVGYHAVQKAQLGAEDVPMVIGCGPVGLAVIQALKLGGFGPIIASDFSAERRAAADRIGADILVDPAQTSPHKIWSTLDIAPTLAEAGARARLGQKGRNAIIFECVGVPGLIQSLINEAPPASRIIIAGVCMAEDRFEPAIAINKQIGLQFVFGYEPDEFAACLRNIADGKIEVGAYLTGRVDLDGVENAFKALSQDPAQIKIMVRPGS